MSSITITLPKQEKGRLTRIASRFGLSLVELSQYVLTTLSESTPMESIQEYDRPITLKQSIRRGYVDSKAGRVHSTL
ncbi:MAG: hypothetical protein WCG02_00810 [Candidatus Taylorbacteria bacterium]